MRHARPSLNVYVGERCPAARIAHAEAHAEPAGVFRSSHDAGDLLVVVGAYGEVRTGGLFSIISADNILPRDVLARRISEFGQQVHAAGGAGRFYSLGPDPGGDIDFRAVNSRQTHAPIAKSVEVQSLARQRCCLEAVLLVSACGRIIGLINMPAGINDFIGETLIP